jgi:hypothetical protein
LTLLYFNTRKYSSICAINLPLNLFQIPFLEEQLCHEDIRATICPWSPQTEFRRLPADPEGVAVRNYLWRTLVNHHFLFCVSSTTFPWISAPTRRKTTWDQKPFGYSTPHHNLIRRRTLTALPCCGDPSGSGFE